MWSIGDNTRSSASGLALLIASIGSNAKTSPTKRVVAKQSNEKKQRVLVIVFSKDRPFQLSQVRAMRERRFRHCL
jgi:hypothetical protein